MLVTYLGHAAFCIESDASVVITDPWLSEDGAFDSAWFQFPPNQHMAPFVQERLADESRERFIYVSHEHQDHFDIGFLQSIENRNFTLVVPHFRSHNLRQKLEGFACKRIAVLEDGGELRLRDGRLRLYIDDSELNRDSALLVEMNGRTFFDMNDCKLFDRLPQIRLDAGHIDAFACQFSGATWHPTCYAYDADRYAALSKKKAYAKFESVARAIEALEPQVYLPSAGPACFLDPALMHLNFEPMNIFPHSEKIAFYLSRRLRKVRTIVPDIGPGAVIDLRRGVDIRDSGAVVSPSDRKDVIERYARDYYERNRHPVSTKGAARATLERLAAAFGQKFHHLTLASQVQVPLYFRMAEEPEAAVKVDFQSASISITTEPCAEQFYELTAPAWQVERVLDGALTWEEFSLTFRVRIRREPDAYQPVLHAFLLLDGEDLMRWCEMTRAIQENPERIVIECGGRQYSVLRHCPHQGGDLSQGWTEGSCVVCPRHRWRFDVADGGRCTTNDTTIDAVEMETAVAAGG
jgi:UDP-MurNAc hydroxylase